MGRPSNTCNGIRFERISNYLDPSVYNVVNLEDDCVIGTVHKTSDGWTAYNEQGEELTSCTKRQSAGDAILDPTLIVVEVKAAPVPEPEPVAAPVVDEPAMLVPCEGNTLPMPVQRLTEQVMWTGKGGKKMFPEEIRSTIRKGRAFSCDEEYNNWNDDLIYVIQSDSCRDFEVPARFFTPC